MPETTSVPNEDRFAYKVERAARLLDCSRAFLYQQIAKGNIATVKIGSARRIPHAELERIAREGA